jgi:hypothetical protein
MTAPMAARPVRPARRGPAAVLPAAPRAAARLLRLELRRSVMLWALPLCAVLFWFDCYRVAMTLSPLWSTRTLYAMGQGHAMIDFGPFVAGAAAWAGARDGRRPVADLVAITALPRWAGRAASAAAAIGWALAGYAVCVGALFIAIARQATGGSPPWWPAVALGAGVAAFAALGFAAGVAFPSRFSAPLAAFGAFLLLATSSQTGFSSQGPYSLILPTRSAGVYGLDTGIFFPWPPDVFIARFMLLAGLAVAATGALGLIRDSGGGRRLRVAAALVTAAGLAAAGTAIGLAGTGRPGVNGAVIPALHDAADSRLVPYTPACSGGTIPVCVHPAYRRYLAAATGALRPVLADLSGLPGVPVRVTQTAATQTGNQSAVTIRGPVLRVSLGLVGVPGIFGTSAADFRGDLQILAAQAIVQPGSPGPQAAGQGAAVPPGAAAQQAVEAALARDAGQPLPGQWATAGFAGLATWARAGTPAYAAAARFAARPLAAQRAWLAGHLPALRAGAVTLAQLP